MNTAARILEACKDPGHRLLVSRDLPRHLALPEDLAARPLGPRAFRGKREPIEIFAVEARRGGRDGIPAGTPG